MYSKGIGLFWKNFFDMTGKEAVNNYSSFFTGLGHLFTSIVTKNQVVKMRREAIRMAFSKKRSGEDVKDVHPIIMTLRPLQKKTLEGP
jgi:hypothetical protein